MDEILKLLGEEEDKEDLKRVAWIAEMIDATPEAVRAWARSGKIPSQKIFGTLRIPYMDFCNRLRIKPGVKYMSPKTISSRFKVTQNCVRGWTYKGNIPGIRIFGSLRIAENEIEKRIKRT
jgi:hypothetical protein